MRKLARIVVNLAAMFVVYITTLLALRPWHNRWGATDEEVEKPLPGDEFAKQGFSSIHAIRIHAPRPEVWKWLVQIGQDRAGFYSFTIFENLFRAEMQNADRINPEWQDLRAGDYVRLATRFIVRSHEGNPIGGHVLNFLFWEPAHFIMETGMLHGIKRRAEHAA